MKTYKAEGKVLGNLWGGGSGAYGSTILENKTRKGLLKEANKLLKSGGLDSGMGFESLIGAVISITETETIKVKGKDYERSEFETIFIGDLTDEEEEFLININI